MQKDKLILLAVRNRKGWVGKSGRVADNLSKAILFKNLSPARSKATETLKNHPNDGVPEIVELTVVSTRVLDEDERVQKAALDATKKHLRKRISGLEWYLGNCPYLADRPFYPRGTVTHSQELKNLREKLAKLEEEC